MGLTIEVDNFRALSALFIGSKLKKECPHDSCVISSLCEDCPILQDRLGFEKKELVIVAKTDELGNFGGKIQEIKAIYSDGTERNLPFNVKEI